MRVARQVVGLQVADDLQAVLQRPQEPVRVGERVGVGLRHVSLFGERRQRAQRVRLAQYRVAPPVHDLQQLHRELHVADPPASPLDLGELLAATTDVLLEPHLGPPDVVDRARLQVLRVDERRHALDERRTDPRVAGDGPRLDHGLALPRGRLVLVVVERRLQAAREHAAAATGAERRVHPERDALGRRLRERSDQARGGALGHLLRLGTGVGVHEDQVDVARVVQLAAAELAQSDHRQRGRRRRQAARGLQARLGHARDLLDDVLQRGAVQVARRHAQHRATTEHAEPVAGAAAGDVAGQLRVELGSRASRTSASDATSSGWRTRKSAAAVENPRSRTATGSTSGRASCSRAPGRRPPGRWPPARARDRAPPRAFDRAPPGSAPEHRSRSSAPPSALVTPP